MFHSSHDGAGQQCCYDQAGYLMMTSDNKWGGKPRRSHNLGVLPWNEANKIPTMSHWLQDIMTFYPCCMWQVPSPSPGGPLANTDLFRTNRATGARPTGSRGDLLRIVSDINHREEVLGTQRRSETN